MTGPDLTAGEQCYMDDSAQRTRSTPLNGTGDDGESTPSQQRPPLDEADSTPRSEVPSVPETVAASLRQQMHAVHDEQPSYFSPQPRRAYSSIITRSTSASGNPSSS